MSSEKTSNSDEHLVVEQLVRGPGTNCYLVYDQPSREAVIIDVAGEIKPLIEIVQTAHLSLRYFLFTHGHFDHLLGFPSLRDEFPDVIVCIHRADFEDMPTQLSWVLKNLDEEILAQIRSDEEASKLLNFDATTFGTPDVFIDDNQVLEFGSHPIKVLHCPGHSPGSVCFQMGDILFSGDVLFRDSVGRVDVLNSSREDQVRSVRRLYAILPESTVVYPGHGEPTSIGREKYHNTRVTVDKVDL